jgi:hypothetical protein
MRPRSWTALAIAAFALACATAPSPFPVTASANDLGALVGEWHGEYGGSTTGRTGSVFFELKPGRDTAHGDVVMLPQRANISPSQAERLTMESVRALAQVLTIRFVRLEGGSLSGSLDPYRDPDCSCTVVTTFGGRLSNPSTIEGSFTTRGVGIPTRVGWWRATRAR